GAQMVQWPDPFCEALAERGFYVIRYDNRETGTSTWLEQYPPPNLPLLFLGARLGLPCRVPDTLDEMAGDAMALLDVLEVPRAHIVGASMGGMIAQLVAIIHPERTLSLTSIMSTTGHRSLPRADRDIMRSILQPPTDTSDFEACVQYSMKINRLLMSPGYPATDQQLRERAERVVSRGVNPAGRMRHLAAVTVGGDRRSGLSKLRLPSSVIHGVCDALVPPAHGMDIARVTPGAELELIDVMAHDLPLPLISRMVDVIVRTAGRA
ncbi:MAG: alpha/beta fold hydrolase, partial [Parahaliea sp.]